MSNKPSNLGIFAKILGNAFGRLMAYTIMYLLALGLVWLCTQIEFLAAIIYGWRFINFITPAMFVWMPIAGWIIYFVIKLFVSAFLGLFIIPYQITKSFINASTGYYDE